MQVKFFICMHVNVCMHVRTPDKTISIYFNWPQAYQSMILEEVKELSASPFGSTLVSTIGEVSLRVSTLCVCMYVCMNSEIWLCCC